MASPTEAALCHHVLSVHPGVNVTVTRLLPTVPQVMALTHLPGGTVRFWLRNCSFLFVSPSALYKCTHYKLGLLFPWGTHCFLEVFHPYLVISRVTRRVISLGLLPGGTEIVSSS